VHIATPTTLVSLLRTAQYAWQQAALSDNARAVFDVGRELYERISGLGDRVDQLGKALTSAVTSYNKAVGSLETRVLVSARRLHDLGIVDTGQEVPRLVEETTRALSAPELTAMAAPGQPTAAASGHAAAAELTAPAPEHPATAATFTGGPGDPAESPPERSHGANEDPGSSPPELVMTRINGAAQ